MNDLQRFLDEDIGSGDITTEIFVPEGDGTATITCEDDAVVAGLEEAAEIFSLLGVKSKLFVKDGQRVKKGTMVMEISGSKKSILTAERTALNMMMQMSGVATITNKILEGCKKINPNIIIAGTRKTTPGFRKYEKKAIELGGGWPHRFGLYDAVLIKDNHITAAGGVKEAMKFAKNVPSGIKVEIEVENITDAIAAAECNPDIIMIDNCSPEETEKLRDAIKKVNPRILVEISGRITIKNVKTYSSFADIISLGALTHSVKAIHFSLNYEIRNGKNN